jgi:hypothetical protein
MWKLLQASSTLRVHTCTSVEVPPAIHAAGCTRQRGQDWERLILWTPSHKFTSFAGNDAYSGPDLLTSTSRGSIIWQFILKQGPVGGAHVGSRCMARSSTCTVAALNTKPR